MRLTGCSEHAEGGLGALRGLVSGPAGPRYNECERSSLLELVDLPFPFVFSFQLFKSHLHWSRVRRASPFAGRIFAALPLHSFLWICRLRSLALRCLISLPLPRELSPFVAQTEVGPAATRAEELHFTDQGRSSPLTSIFARPSGLASPAAVAAANLG